MARTSLEVYALAVCFMTIAHFTFTAHEMVNSLIRLVNPAFAISTRVFEKHLNNDQFWYNVKPKCSAYDNEGCGDGGLRPSEDVLTQRREASYAIALRSEVMGGQGECRTAVHHHRDRCAHFRPALADSTSCSYA